jgi:hypothetical protein
MEVVAPSTGPPSAQAAAPVPKSFRIASDPEDSGYDSVATASTFRGFQLDRFSRPVDDESESEPDRFADPFDATPSRSSVSPATEDPQPAIELSAKDEKKVEQLQEAAQKSEEILPRVTERITSIMQQQIMPAAHQVVDSGAPIVLQIGKSAFKLTLRMAEELIKSPILHMYIAYGFMLDNKLKPEHWTDALYRKVITGEPPPVWSQYHQMWILIDNMSLWGLYGARRHMYSVGASQLSALILKQIEAADNLAPGSIRKIARVGFQSLQGLYKVYQMIQSPMNAVLALTNTARDPDSDHDPTARSSNQQLALPDRPASSSKSQKLADVQADRRRKLKEDQQASSSKSQKLEDVQAERRRKLKEDQQASSSKSQRLADVQADRRRKLIEDATPSSSSGEGRGQQALGKRAPLVNYGAGVRQMRKGGGKTIRAMAPILEFNETADDPYLMRQQAH